MANYEFALHFSNLASEWYCDTQADEIDRILARIDLTHLLRKTDGLFNRKALAAYVVHHTDLIQRVIRKLSRNADDFRRHELHHLEISNPKRAHPAEDPESTKFTGQWSTVLASAMKVCLAERIHSTKWWGENATQVRVDSRKLRLTKKVMES